MAELERIANHFGDIGAICNDASFSLIYAECGMLRERTLRAAQACFGHRLMMDRDRAGRRRRRSRRRRRRAASCAARDGAARFPELIEIYDNTASLQDRTVTTGYLAPTLARAFGAGGYVGRASGRAFDARKAVWLRALRRARIRGAGARRRRRQRAGVDPHPRGRAEPRADRADPRTAAGRARLTRQSASPAAVREGLAWSRASVAIYWCRSASAMTARSSAAICATRPGSNGRCWKPRSKATSSPTSRSATNPSTAPIRATISRDRHAQIAVQKLVRAARDRSRRRRPMMLRLPSSRQISTAQRAVGSAAASSIREVDAGSCNACELEIHALNNAFYDLERFGLRFVASPRHADVLLVTGPGHQEHARGAGAHLCRDARSEMGGGGRRLRRRRRHFCRELCGAKGVSRGSCRWICTSAAARQIPQPC